MIGEGNHGGRRRLTVGENTLGLQCARQFDDQTWFLAGAVEESSGEGLPVGQWLAVTVRDTSPQQVNLYGQAEGTWDDCAQFVGNISDSAVEGPEMIGPVKEGGITLPSATAAVPDPWASHHPARGRAAQPSTSAASPNGSLALPESRQPSELQEVARTRGQVHDRARMLLDMFDDTTWILGGEIVRVDVMLGRTVGTRIGGPRPRRLTAAGDLLVRGLASPAAAGCPAFVNAIPDDDIANAGFTPVEEGEITLPAGLGGCRQCSEPVPVA